MGDFLNYAILALYILGMVTVAIVTRKRSSNSNEFLMAGKGLGGWMTAFAYGTTYFSAVVFVGYAGKFGASFGLSVVWIGIGNAILGAYLAWKFLAKRTRNMTRRLEVRTMPEFFDKRYDGKYLKLVSGIIIFVFLIPYSASVYQGLGYLFGEVFHIDSVACIIIMAAITAVYLFFGGYFATALSDFIQGIIMFVGVAVMVFSVLNYPSVDWGNGFTALIDSGKGFFPTDTGNVPFIFDKTVTLISLVLLTSMGTWALPQTIHKFYAIKGGKAIKQGTVVSTLFCLVIGVGAYMTGAFSGLFEAIDFSNMDTVVPQMLKLCMASGFLGLIAVLTLSASMSTLASVSLCGSSTISLDIYKGYINKDASDKRVTVIMRVACIIFVVISALLAIFPIEAIVSMMGLSWGTLSGCFIGPFVLGLYSKKITKAATWASLVGGLVFTAVMTVVFGLITPSVGTSFGAVLKAGLSHSPLTGVLCMFFSVIITFVVSLFTKAPKAETINESFEKEIDDLV